MACRWAVKGSASGPIAVEGKHRIRGRAVPREKKGSLRGLGALLAWGGGRGGKSQFRTSRNK